MEVKVLGRSNGKLRVRVDGTEKLVTHAEHARLTGKAVVAEEAGTDSETQKKLDKALADLEAINKDKAALAADLKVMTKERDDLQKKLDKATKDTAKPPKTQ
ncbi:MAG: hypothetical protein JST51_01505 [Armatimonadetes bacterium]|nr:hypothetical protein [Armatimonadota bacterium]